MAPQIGEHCENCFKHPKKLRHLNSARCEACLPDDANLRKCNACKIVRYCSRDCQKAHWKEHKFYCAVNVGIKQVGEQMGAVVAGRQKSLEKWCIKHWQDICLAALSALEIMRDRGRTETHVFMVYLDVVDCGLTQASRKPRFVHSVREARSTPLSQIHEMYDSRFIAGYATLERSLAPRPKLMRILVADEGLPVPLDLYTLPTELNPCDGRRPFDPNWFSYLKFSVDEV